MFDGTTYSELGFGLDIAPSTIALGAGWHGLERDESGQFRRIAGDAQALFASAGFVYEVTIDVAPEQGASSVTLEARVDDVVQCEKQLHGRTFLRFVAPPGEPAMRRISLAANGGSARVYRFAALPCARDVVQQWLGFRVGGGGWYALEESGRELFRYVNREAEIVVGRPARSFELDVEAGPGVDYGPFLLDVSIAGGERICSARIERRTRLTVELPTLQRLPARLSLRCDGGGRPALTDARLMDFRLFTIPAPWERGELLRSLAALAPAS